MLRFKAAVSAVIILSAIGFIGAKAEADIIEQCTTPPSGMVSWWGGDNSVLDFEGSNNGTMMNGAAYASGMVGEAFSLNGTNQYVEVPDSATLRLPAAVTLDAWINTANPSASQPIVVKAQTLGNWHSYYLSKGSDGKLYFEVDNWSVGRYGVWRTDFTPSADTWYHIAVTWQNVYGDVRDAKIYINGVEQPAQLAFNQGYDPSFSLYYTSMPLYIGRDANGSSYFNGRIDEVEVFDRALSSSEIAAIYNAGSAGKCKDRNLDFELDADGVSGQAVSRWGYDFYTMNDSGTHGPNPQADHILNISSARSFSGSKSVYSRIRSFGGSSNWDSNYHYATHELTSNYFPQAGKTLNAVTIWRSAISYTTSSRWFYWFFVDMTDGTNSYSEMLACRAWGNSEGCTGNYQDTSDMNAIGADGQTWYRHRIIVPAEMDQSKLKIIVGHTERSWDGSSAESSFYYDLLGEEFTNYTLDVNLAGSGSVTSNPSGIDCGSDCTEVYEEGTAISLAASADAGYTFTGWSGDCDADGQVTMDADKTCTAAFECSDPYEIINGLYDDANTGVASRTIRTRLKGTLDSCYNKMPAALAGDMRSLNYAVRYMEQFKMYVNRYIKTGEINGKTGYVLLMTADELIASLTCDDVQLR